MNHSPGLSLSLPHTSIRSVWPLGRERRVPLLLGAGAWVGAAGVGPEPEGAWFGILPLLQGRSLLCVPWRSAARATLRLNGLPVPGGLACVRHGDVVRVTLGSRRLSYWLSVEGPARLAIAQGDTIDAFTLEPLSAGTPGIACDCGAWFFAETWCALRRCPTCSFVEDGEFHALPPEFAEAGA